MSVMELKLKKEKLNKIITIILVGLLLLIIVVPIGEGSGEKELDGVSVQDDTISYNTYAEYYEQKLKTILEKSYGQGTMEIMIHMREEDTSDYMYDDGSTMEVDGILIVADVESDVDVGNISFAVCSLFDLPAHKVAVIKK